jgi:UDP-perosamine 4-acetyltransferase
LRIAVVGAGGHGKAVADAIIASDRHDLAGFFDDDSPRWGTMHFDLPVLGPAMDWQSHRIDALIVAIGDNTERKRQFEALNAAGASFASVVHPCAVLAKGVALGEGTVVLANAVLNPDVRIGENCILNTAASVDHDCIVGPHCHLAPGARVTGEVHIGEGVFAGAGAIIVPGLSIGNWTTIAAGAVVVRDAPACTRLAGVPAKAI